MRLCGHCTFLYPRPTPEYNKALENLMFPRAPVGLTGFEPATFCSQSRRATKLRYSPLPERQHQLLYMSVRPIEHATLAHYVFRMFSVAFHVLPPGLPQVTGRKRCVIRVV